NLVGNTASNNDYGFYLASFSSNNNLVGNTASNNRKDGFLILFNSCNNNLVGNTASNNDEDGFHLTQSSYNNLSDNKAQSNLYGFYLYYLSNNNNLTGNTAKYNLRGFYLYRSSYNIIRSNTIITYQSGNEIYQDTDSHDNIIEDNTIINEEMLINLIGNSLFSYEMSKQANTIFLILGSLLAVALIGAVTVHIMREKPPPVKGKLEPKPKKWKPPPMRHLSTPI
ncbi:MAG: NosD domain-containing protein, partial [Candidatus Freyarchaeota archaeon]